MAKHLKYLVEQNKDDFGFDTLGRVDSLFLARELALAVCRISPGAIIEISEVDETNTAEYLETVDGYEVAA
jgi:hypothetical protein